MDTRRRWWPLLKAILAGAILVFLALRFAGDLRRPELYEGGFAPSPGWLAASAVLYLAGLAFSGVFWHRLLTRTASSPPSPAVALKAYFVSQLGKYLPGKAWAVVLRIGMVRNGSITVGVGTVTTFYEVLTTMASGALLAFALLVPLSRDLDGLAFAGIDVTRPRLLLLSAALVAVTLGVVLPPIFNRVASRLSAVLRRDGVPARASWSWLAEGLTLTAPVWLCFGLSLACVLSALPNLPDIRTPDTLARITAVTALAYVAGFVVVLTPGGIGVREFFLTELLAPEFATSPGDEAVARGRIVLAVLLLRLVWTAAELALAGLLYLLVRPVPVPEAGR